MCRGGGRRKGKWEFFLWQAWLRWCGALLQNVPAAWDCHTRSQEYLLTVPVSLRWAEPTSSSPGWEMGNCSGDFGHWVGNGNVHLAGTHCFFPYKEKRAVILKHVWFEGISSQILIIHTTKIKKKAKQKRNPLRILEGKGGLNQTKWWNQCPCI